MSVASLPKRSPIEARLARTLYQAALARAIADQKPELVEAARETSPPSPMRVCTSSW